MSGTTNDGDVKPSWLQEEFAPWDPKEIRKEDAKRKKEDAKMAACMPASECKVVMRFRHASSMWEHFVKKVVGDPVHVDVVVSKAGATSGKFCFSSYMHQKFEMSIMSGALVHDSHITNMCIGITPEEYDRCMTFLTALEGRASYSYFDAMVLMPIAPKQVGRMACPPFHGKRSTFLPTFVFWARVCVCVCLCAVRRCRARGGTMRTRGWFRR